MAATVTAPIRESQINNTLYVGEVGFNTIQAAVSYAVYNGGAVKVVIPFGYLGSDPISAVTGGSDIVFISDERNGYIQSYAWNGSNYVAMPFMQEDGFTTPGNIQAATATITGDLTSNSAEFASCLVANSPVRTFANSADPGGGMEWPPAGIGVSTGTSWSPNSINPAEVPLLDVSNNLSVPGTVTAYGNLQLGMAVGAAAIHPAVVSDGLNLFCNANPGGAVNFNWDRGNNGVNFCDGSEHVVASINNSGTASFLTNNFTITGPSAGPTLTSAGNLILDVAGTSGIFFNYHSGTGGIHFCNGAGVDIATIDASGNAAFNNGTVGILTAQGNLQIGSASTAAAIHPAVVSDGSNLFLDGYNGGAVNFNWDKGSGVNFCNGSEAVVASVDGAGNAHFNGNLSASGTKPFRITHPLDSSKYLFHACIEGPESGVYYRGEAQTNDYGIVEITLPEYFEALTRPEDRTVQITQILEDENDLTFGCFFAAGRVADGKFKVRSSKTGIKFFWEVKAVRADIDRLEVVRDRRPHEQ